MKQTTNYAFNQPELTDIADITQISDNFDTIDTELKHHHDAVENLKGKGSITTPVYIDKNGVPQAITSYSGKSNTAGTADNANSLNANAGSATVPVYFENGVPVACSGNTNRISYGTTDLTAGSSTLASGSFYFVYR